MAHEFGYIEFKRNGVTTHLKFIENGEGTARVADIQVTSKEGTVCEVDPDSCPVHQFYLEPLGKLVDELKTNE